jgi:hypothetical protein
MEWFYFVVIVVAIILLIIMLAYIGTRMVSDSRSGVGSSVFPPVKNTCPDLWESTMSGNMVSCKIPASSASNVGDLYTNGKSDAANFDIGTVSGSLENRTVTFSANTENTMGTSGDCAKKKWANTHGVLWDGISNYNQC